MNPAVKGGGSEDGVKPELVAEKVTHSSSPACNSHRHSVELKVLRVPGSSPTSSSISQWHHELYTVLKVSGTAIL